MLKNKLGEDSPIPKFLHLQIRRRDGVESLTVLEEGEFKVPIDGCIKKDCSRGGLYPVSPYLTIATGISHTSFVRVSTKHFFLSKGISKYTQISRQHWYQQLVPPKASAVSIELLDCYLPFPIIYIMLTIGMALK